MTKRSIFAVAALFLIACGDDDTEDTSNTDTGTDVVVDSGTPETDDDTGGAETVAPDTDVEDDTGVDDDAPTGTCDDDGTFISRFRGTIVDEEGAPITTAKAVVCIRASSGALNCLRPAGVDEAGNFVVDVPESSRCVASVAIRAFDPSADRGPNFCDLDVSESGNVMYLESPLPLYTTTRATTLPELGDAATERTVVFHNGLELDVTPSDYFGVTDGYELLGVAEVDPTTPLCFLKDSPALDGLYTFSPEGNISSTGYPFRVPNTTGLAAGTVVDFYVLGGLGTSLPDGSELHEAVWATFGTGTVSADGTVIENAEGLGLPALTWMGWAAAE